MMDLKVTTSDRVESIDGLRISDQIGRIEGPVKLSLLDKPIPITQETRVELPSLSEAMRNTLRNSGWPERALDDIGSEAEAKIYHAAGLEAQDVNGKPALVRTDIVPDKKDGLGQTNLERMQSGRAPLDHNDQPIELHHIGQKQDSCLAELTHQEHTGGGNDNILHNKKQESTIDRDGFAKERAAHWKARASAYEAGN